VARATDVKVDQCVAIAACEVYAQHDGHEEERNVDASRRPEAHNQLCIWQHNDEPSGAMICKASANIKTDQCDH
jgi:hypothetical protein